MAVSSIETAVVMVTVSIAVGTVSERLWSPRRRLSLREGPVQDPSQLSTVSNGRLKMNIVHATGIIGIILCLSMVPVTTARADVVGKEPGTSPNPEDNVPKNIQRSALGESAYPTGSSGPGTRSDELVGM